MRWQYVTRLSKFHLPSGQRDYPLGVWVTAPQITVKAFSPIAAVRKWVRAGYLEVYVKSKLGNLLYSSHFLQFDQQIIDLPSEPCWLVYRPRKWIQKFEITLYAARPSARLDDMLKLGYHSFYLTGQWDFGLNNDPIQRITPTVANAGLLMEPADPDNPAHNGLFYRFYNLNEFRNYTIKPKDPSKNSGTPDTIAISYGYTDLLYYAAQDMWLTGKILL